jgi:TPP-dependent pyruvate/acetoin dehydrogenase alpha subunit
MAFGMTGRKNVCLTHVGDGGTSTGAFHEGLNFAAVRRLPVVVVIENNGYAYSTPVAKQTRQPDFSRRGPAYGVPGVKVDGNDVLAVHAAAREAVQRAREGGGPTVIEAETFRMGGHAEHDDAGYVPKELLEAWKERDPIALYERRLLADSVVTAEELRTIAAGIEARLDEDQKWAEDSPLPAPESGLSDVTCP